MPKIGSLARKDKGAPFEWTLTVDAKPVAARLEIPLGL